MGRCGGLWLRHLLWLTLSSHDRIDFRYIDYALLLRGRCLLGRRSLLDLRLLLHRLALLYRLRCLRPGLHGLWCWCPVHLLRGWL